MRLVLPEHLPLGATLTWGGRELTVIENTRMEDGNMRMRLSDGDNVWRGDPKLGELKKEEHRVKPKYRIRISELLITKERRFTDDWKEITVAIVDEGAGPFLRIYTDADGFALDSERQDAVRLDFEEFNFVAEAVKRLETEWADELAATLPQEDKK